MRTIYRNIVGGFIFSEDNKLLIGKSHKGGVYANHWIIPGGGVEQDETHMQALVREILEETGLDITNIIVEELGYGGSGSSEKTLRNTGERVQVEMEFYNFVVRLPGSADMINVTTEDDFIQPRWIGAGEISSIVLSPPTIVTLKKIGYIN